MKRTLEVIGECELSDTGTKASFKPDSEIFEIHEFTYDTLANRFREIAFLNRGLNISLKDERNEKKEVFCYSDGS